MLKALLNTKKTTVKKVFLFECVMSPGPSQVCREAARIKTSESCFTTEYPTPCWQNQIERKSQKRSCRKGNALQASMCMDLVPANTGILLLLQACRTYGNDEVFVNARDLCKNPAG